MSSEIRRIFSTDDLVVSEVRNRDEAVIGYLMVEFDEVLPQRSLLGMRHSLLVVQPIADWILVWTEAGGNGEPYVDGRIDHDEYESFERDLLKSIFRLRGEDFELSILNSEDRCEVLRDIFDRTS